MAAIPPARTRSLRATAPTLTRPQQQQTSNNASTMTRKPQAAPDSATHGPSPLSLFLTNMRLLDLDLLPDWPGISATTFHVAGSGTGAAQAQKRRVGCVEWALFRLFEIYDAEETRTKLKPFFPPQDQVQSVNLRAALSRGLETAKKSGVLGKDTILRKTMLDDCRGERLEEVLAAFSTAVLKMVVADEEPSTPALRVALESRGYQDNKTDLLVLGLVHRAALSKALRRRKENRAKFRDFEDLLSVKERGLERRKEEVKALNDAENGQRGKTVSKDAVREMRHTVRNNWAGNEQWMDTLMYGDAKGGGEHGGPFGMPFERVWRRVEQSRLDELEEGGAGLLGQLERRVRGHEERLAKWERFRDGLRGARKGPARAEKKVEESDTKGRGLDMGFGAHKSLQLGRPGEDKTEQVAITSSVRVGTATKQDQFIEDLERDLEQASGTNLNPRETLGFLFDRQPAAKAKDTLKAPDAGHDLPSEISDLEDHDLLDERQKDEEAPKSFDQRKMDGLKRFPVRPKLNYPMNDLARKNLEDEDEVAVPKKDTWTRNAPKLPRPQRISSYGEEEPEDAPKPLRTRTRTASSSRTRMISRSRSISPEKQLQHTRQRSVQHEEVPPHNARQLESPAEADMVHEQQPEPVSPTQDLADEILENMKNASPSPAKPSRPRHKLSLAERTRMSMARGSLFSEEDEELEIPNLQKDPSPSDILSENAEEAEPSPTEDLASRTRRSMAGFEKARQKAQLDRRRSIRKSKAMGPPIKEGSYFPKVQEEGEGGSVLAEELMAEEDMEAVFKSRPKIAASPIPSPTREWEDE